MKVLSLNIRMNTSNKTLLLVIGWQMSCMMTSQKKKILLDSPLHTCSYYIVRKSHRPLEIYHCYATIMSVNDSVATLPFSIEKSILVITAVTVWRLSNTKH